MPRKPRSKPDPFERAIELALHPAEFIPDRACFSFVNGVEEIAARIAKLKQSDPARAITLYETFLAGCYEKVGELDDSSGGFGQFVANLYCGWIEAREAASADPDDTAAQLLAWMEDDPYGFCHQLEKDAVQAFNKAGLGAFERQIRARFDAAAAIKPASGGSLRSSPEYARRRWGEMLRTLYLAQKNVQAYVALAEETGLTARDCHALATLLLARRKPADALAWVERGLAIDGKTSRGFMAAHDLAKLKRVLLTKLGRGGEALEAAWAAYRQHPRKRTYDELIKFVPKPERSVWHEKALDAARGANFSDGIHLLLGTQELERLAQLVDRSQDDALEGISHYATEPAAKKLEKTRPDLAARLWRAQGMRIVSAKKSKYYDAALANFERARRCFEKAGLSAEWEKTVHQVRAEHRRKTGFMPGFEEIVAGSGPSQRPSFLTRAKARWGRSRTEER